MSEDLRAEPSRADQAVDRAEYIRILEDRIKALHAVNDSFGDLANRVEELERDRDALRQDRDAFSENLSTAQRHLEIAVAGEGFYAQFKAAEAKLAEYANTLVEEANRHRDTKAEVERLRAEFESLLRTYNAAAQAWGRDEAALTAERARLEALLDVSERKLGEWRDRGAELERLRADVLAEVRRVVAWEGVEEDSGRTCCRQRKCGCAQRILARIEKL